MPAALVDAYLAMLPRLEAEERLAAHTDMAISLGHVEAARARQIRAELQRAASGGERTVKADRQLLNLMGIAVEVADD